MITLCVSYVDFVIMKIVFVFVSLCLIIRNVYVRSSFHGFVRKLKSPNSAKIFNENDLRRVVYESVHGRRGSLVVSRGSATRR